MTFKKIEHILDIKSFVADKPEIRFTEQSNGCIVGCYVFCDSHTFDTPEAMECRGIAFDQYRNICSRPLHKFFNVGEKPWLSVDAIRGRRNDIVGIYQKLDGSMIATAWVNGKVALRSRKSFESDVVKLAWEIVDNNSNVYQFMHAVVIRQWTAIFELTHPDARIVVNYPKPALRLLHVRDNVTGEYLMLDSNHPIHTLIAQYQIECVQKVNKSFDEILVDLETMEGEEGYVIQFADGTMAKAKGKWYLRLHKSITFLRSRDIARLALNNELDDIKSALIEAGIDLQGVERVESEVKVALIGLEEAVEALWEADKHLDRKAFAIKNKEHPLFSLAMMRYTGKEVDLPKWYIKNRLDEDFGLEILADRAGVIE